MARRTNNAQAQVQHYCRECAHAHTPHERNCDGEFFLLKCPFMDRSVFMKERACDQFKQKQF